ncbi:MAG: LamG domain-containing protein [Paramuribaculum sp.]|nr:LamG domain-containing protein [Paramuribaculum sp.]
MMIRSILATLISLVCLAPAQAQTNNAYSKTARTSVKELQEQHLYVSPEVIRSVPATAEVAPSYSVGAWVKIDGLRSVPDVNNVQQIFGYSGREHLNDNGCWELCLSPEGTLILTGWGGAATSDLNTARMPLGEYVHLLVTYDAPTRITSVYLNGELYGTKKWSRDQEWFFDEYPAICFAGWQFGGEMDQIQIFSKSLSPREVVRAMSNPRAVDGLAALYTLDETAPGAPTRFDPVAGNSTEQLVCEMCRASSTKNVWENGMVYLIDGAGSVSESVPMLVPSDREIKYVDVRVDIAPGIENGELIVLNGSRPVGSGSTVTCLTPLTFETRPAPGYRLMDITATTDAGTELVTADRYTVVSDVTFFASFTDEVYPLTIDDNANLEYTLTRNGLEVTDLTELLGGDTYQLAVVVPFDYTLRSVTFNGDAITPDEADGLYSFTITGPSVIVIDAVAKPRYTVTTVPSPCGTLSVTCDGVEVASGSTVAEGSLLTIVATPEQGWQVYSITADDCTISNVDTCTVRADVVIEAQYIEQLVEHCIPTPVAGRSNGNLTRQISRYLTGATISDGANSIEITDSGDYTNYVFGTEAGRPVYDVTAIIPQFETRPGRTITVTTTGDGEWMNTFIYFDANANGLDRRDKVYGNYTGNSNKYDGTRTFTIPANLKPGRYRMRYMINWDDNQGPCEYGQASDNGDLIFDVDFVIPQP